MIRQGDAGSEPMDVFVTGKNYYNQLVDLFPFLTISFMDKLYARKMNNFLLINKRFTFYFYIIVATLQEFITREMFQSTLQRFMIDKTNGVSAIALCSLIFTVLHLHISLSYAAVSMLFSFIWGLMYKRHKTIAGTSLSHFLIGNMGRLLGV